ILETYKKTIEDELAIPVLVGKKSEKEKFVGAVYTTTMEAMMPDGKALQMGTSHFLGQNFSKPFEVKFSDKDNVETFVWQTSWGVSWRLIGAMIMIHGDDKGLVLPPKVAPIQVVIVPIYYTDEDEKKVLEKASEIEKTLENKGLRVHVDKRSQLTPGFKFHDWELRGIPLRVEVGPKDLAKQKVVLVKRHSRQKTDVSLDKLENDIIPVLDEIQKELFESAKKLLSQMTQKVSDYDQFKSKIEAGGFFEAPWCGNQKCEEKIKEETGADIRVIPFDSKNADGKCILCKSKSVSNVVLARGY
ncbi:MAG: proline--tRNA ligase, partial [Thaumarchaeota archaeon]|nr:proline--tRNA ligase [Nitrososphaerota archaeon]